MYLDIATIMSDGDSKHNKRFWDIVSQVLDGPPYYLVLVLSYPLALKGAFGEIVFIFSVVGRLWRHIITDLKKLFSIRIDKPINHWLNWIITGIYHIGNLSLFYYFIALKLK